MVDLGMVRAGFALKDEHRVLSALFVIKAENRASSGR